MAPAGLWHKGEQLFNRMKSYYSQSEAHHYPPIDQSTAALLTVIFFTALYVSPFYLSSSLRTNSRINRNSPTTIKARTRSAVLTTLASTVITVYVLAVPGLATPREVLAVLGFYPVDLLDIAKCLLLVAILFVGPLFEAAVIEGDWRQWGTWSSFRETLFDSWIGYRNLVVGPVTEEIVWRSLSVSLFLLAQSNPNRIVFEAPLIFGLAHLHHFHEHVLANQPSDQSYLATMLTPMVLIQGLVKVIFQLIYTSLFGFFVTFVFLRTGNVWSCIVAHTFCNWMGLPRVWGRVGNVVSDEIDRAAENKRSDAEETRGGDSLAMQDLKDTVTPGPNDQVLGLQWTAAYYFLLVLGAWGFYKLLWPLTESTNSLADFQ